MEIDSVLVPPLIPHLYVFQKLPIWATATGAVLQTIMPNKMFHLSSLTVDAVPCQTAPIKVSSVHKLSIRSTQSWEPIWLTPSQLQDLIKSLMT